MALSAGDTVVWYGSTDTDWEVVTNWSPQEIPINQVHVVVSASAVNSMLLNLDRQGDTAGAGLDLRTFHIEGGCTVDVGASGAPLKCTVHNTLKEPSIEHHGDGTFHYSAETGTSSPADLTDFILVNSPNMDIAFQLTGDVAVAGLVAISGRTVVGSAYTGVMAYLFVRHGRYGAVEPVVSVEAHASARIAYVFARAGVIDIAREVTAIALNGGVYTQEAEYIYQAEVYGGVFNFNSTTTMDVLRMMGGVCDTTGNALPKTIAQSFIAPEATLVRSPRLTIGTEWDIFGDNVD